MEHAGSGTFLTFRGSRVVFRHKDDDGSSSSDFLWLFDMDSGSFRPKSRPDHALASVLSKVHGPDKFAPVRLVPEEEEGLFNQTRFALYTAMDFGELSEIHAEPRVDMVSGEEKLNLF